MARRTKKQNHMRLLKLGFAENSEQQRLIEENKELQSEITSLQIRYGMPHFKNNKERKEWLASLSFETIGNIRKEMDTIAQNYGISKRRNHDLWDKFWSYQKLGYSHAIGFPDIHYEWVEDQDQLVEHIIITPETDLDNPLIIEDIKEWQQEQIAKVDKPPQPQPIKGSKRLDWRPVWEWAMRHPQITRRKIATLLYRDYTEVKRKLEDLDNAAGNPPFLYFQK